MVQNCLLLSNTNGMAKKTITIQVDPDLVAELKGEAKAKDRSFQAHVQDVLLARVRNTPLTNE